MYFLISGLKGLTDSDYWAFVPKTFGKLFKNTISRNYKIINRRLLSCVKELTQNVSFWSQAPQSIMVASVWGIVVQLQMDAVSID